MVWLGIACGLAAACSQSISYVFSRRFIVKRGGHPVSLLVLAHVLIGFLGVALTPLVWKEAIWQWKAYGPVLTGASGFYLMGQTGLFCALQRSEASRVAPLLGLKIVMVALVWVVLLNRSLSWDQWAAVALSVLAAFVLNYTGGKLPLFVSIIVPCSTLGFALSDVHIVALIEILGGREGWRAPMLAACLAYSACGLVAILLLPWAGSRDWRGAAPYAAAWFLAMVFFFTTLALIGPVMGNIILSSRGLLSIALGVVLARIGMVHLESPSRPGIVIRRIAAAALMVAAVALFTASS